jgi:hypothetical protein
VLTDLVERREALVRRSEAQRELISEAASAAARKLLIVDVASAWVQRIGWRPAILGGALLASLALGPRKALGWAARAGAIYSAIRQVRRLFAAIL